MPEVKMTSIQHILTLWNNIIEQIIQAGLEDSSTRAKDVLVHYQLI